MATYVAYLLSQLLPDDVLMWFGIIIGAVVALAIGATVALFCARWLFARRAGEIVLLLALLAIGGVGSSVFGVRQTIWWMTIPLAGVAGCIILAFVASFALGSGQRWVAALGAVTSVLLVHVVAHFLFAWSHVSANAEVAGGAKLVAAAAAVAALSALSGFLACLVDRRNLVTVLVAAIAFAAMAPPLLTFSKFALVVEAGAATGIVGAGYFVGFLVGASKNATALVR